jgi:hypothetical protein
MQPLNSYRKNIFAFNLVMMLLFGLTSITSGNTTNHDLSIVSEILGSQFVVPQVGGQHRYYLFSPLGEARVKALIGSVQKTFILTEGQLTTFEAGSDNTVAARFFSTAPIALYHLGHNGDTQRNDVFAVPPASKTVYGVHSNTVVGALYNNTNLQITTSDGAIFPLVLNAGDKLQPTLGAALTQNQDVALKISADLPIAAMAYNDGDGNEASAFWPANFFKTHYRLPTSAQYAAIVCTQANTQVTLTQGTETSSHPCSSDGTLPGKTYLGSALNGEALSQGSLIAATQPIYLVYEDAVHNDERNLWGANLGTVPEPPAPTTAAASFGGTLTENTQWIAGVNYQANANLIVPAGITATIRSGAVVDMTTFNASVQGSMRVEAGATLKFSNNRYLQIQADGLLSATGTSTQPVIFTSNSPTPASGSWSGLRPQERARLALQYARIEYSHAAVLYSAAQISGFVKYYYYVKLN